MIDDYPANTWRTPTKEEMEYLIKNRPNANELICAAQVNDVNGMILLPDNWVCPAGVTIKYGYASGGDYPDFASYQSLSTDQWSILEKAGAVFLPSTGFRKGPKVYDVGYRGLYWSSSELIDAGYYACFLGYYSDEAFVSDASRLGGQGVRLVRDL